MPNKSVSVTVLEKIGTQLIVFRPVFNHMVTDNQNCMTYGYRRYREIFDFS